MRVIVVGVAALLSHAMAHTAYAEPVSFEYGTNCRKNSTGGCTGDQTSCYQAPADHIILRSSLKMDVNPSGKSPRCNVSYDDMKSISVTTAGGQTFTMNEPSKMCINAHIESGSGPMDLGKGFNVKCRATFDLQETE